MSDIVAASVQQPRDRTTLIGVFALVALLLAAIGVYGVMAYGVNERTREIGVRVALGADTGDVVRLIIRGALGMTSLGVVLGLAGGFMASRLLGSLLFGVGATDLPTFLGAAVVILGVAALASWLPARRAARVDPAVALAGRLGSKGSESFEFQSLGTSEISNSNDSDPFDPTHQLDVPPIRRSSSRTLRDHPNSVPSLHLPRRKPGGHHRHRQQTRSAHSRNSWRRLLRRVDPRRGTRPRSSRTAAQPEGGRGVFGRLIRMSLASCWLWALYTPAILALSRRVRIDRTNWPRTVPIHLAAAALATFIDVALMRAIAPYLNAGAPTLQHAAPRHVPAAALPVLRSATSSSSRSAHVRYYASLSYERDLRAATLETQLAEARLTALQGQLRPHFLFNTLNMIAEQVYTDPAGADAMLTRLGVLLRSSFTEADRERVPLRRELELLESYIEIMRARFRGRLTFELDVEPATLDALVPRFILQPLVENAIKHGVEPREEGGRVTVTARRAWRFARPRGARQRRRPRWQRSAKARACETRASGCTTCTVQDGSSSRSRLRAVVGTSHRS